ncbi:MAG: DUF2784 domain-containing protein [Gemmatimonadales bacterium]
MLARVAADLMVLVHLLFVVYVVAGALLVLRWPATAWLHLPAAVWGALIELTGWICPLTPLENRLRAQGGEAGYAGGFIEHYVLPVLYPDGLTPGNQRALGLMVIALNLALYSLVVRRVRRRARSSQ